MEEWSTWVGTLDSYRAAGRLGILGVWTCVVCMCVGVCMCARAEYFCHLVSRATDAKHPAGAGHRPAQKYLPHPQIVRASVEKMVEEANWTEKPKWHLLCSFAQSPGGSNRESSSNLFSAPNLGILLACCCCQHLSLEINESIERWVKAKADSKSRLLICLKYPELHPKQQICVL